MWNIALPTARWYDVDTPGLGELIETVDKYDVVAVDTETTGLNVIKDFPLFWSLAYGPPGKVERVCLSAATLQSFAPLFKKQNKRWVFANAKYDAHMLANVGIPIVGNLVDTQVMHALLYEEFPHGLKDMAKQILGWKWSDFFDTFGKPSKTVTAGDLLMKVFHEAPDKLVDYASNDTYGTLELFYILDEMLCNAPTISTLHPSRRMCLADLFYETEMPFTKVLWKCERAGLRVDTQKLKAMESPMQQEMDGYRAEMWKLAGGEFNPNSPMQLREYFYERMKYPVLKKTKGGKKGAPTPSVDAEVLAKLADDYEDEMAKTVVKYRELSKLHNTYVIGLGDCVDNQGRIHTRFNQDIARCMPAGELVLTDKGYRPVENIQVGDYVVTHKARLRKVTEVTKHAPEPIYYVELADGHSLRTNGEHPYLCEDNWVPASRLRIGQSVVSLRKTSTDTLTCISSGHAKYYDLFTTSTVRMLCLDQAEETYGLTVEEDHSHVTGGIVTHNTGRLSSSDPNLQNIPRHREGMYDLRSAFIPAPGMRMIVADYEALEMRILADQAGEADMIDIFLQGLDIHAGNGSLVFGYPYDDVMHAKDLDDDQWASIKSDPDKYTYLKSCKKARGDAKTVCFGLNYGMQEFNLSKKLKCSVPEAKAKMEQYLDRYPSVRNFFQDAVQIVLDTGCAFTYLGRRRTLTDIDADNKFLRNRAERQASNLPIQGCIPENTRILTVGGLLPIGDAPEVGVVWTGTKWAQYTKLNRGECELATIELKNGQVLNCDTRHSVLVLENGEYQFKEWKALKEGDEVCLSMAEPREFGQDRGCTEDLYWMGFATGNGCSSKGAAHANAITITFGDRLGRYNKEEKSNEFVQYVLNALHVTPQKPSVYENKISITVDNKSVRQLWSNLGYHWGKTAPHKRVPTSVWTATLQGRKAFLRGMFDADGSIGDGKKAQPNIHLCQRPLLDEIQILLRTVGVESTVRTYPDGSSRLDANGAHMVEHLQYGIKRANATGVKGMSSSYEVYHRINDAKLQHPSHKTIQYKARRGCVLNPYTAKHILQSVGAELPIMYATSKVVATKALGVVETTYTLSVDDPLHRFDSEGVISKNSAADVAKMAMIRCDQSNLSDYGWTMLSQVHDELIFEGPPETTAEAMRTITECMEHPFDRDLKVPLKISIKDGNSWAEAK